MSHTAAQLKFFPGPGAMVSTGSWLTSEMRVKKFQEDFELGAPSTIRKSKPNRETNANHVF